MYFPFEYYISCGSERKGDWMEIAEDLKRWTGEVRLPELIHYHYGIQVEEASPYQGVIWLKTDQGDFALKYYHQEKQTYQTLQQMQELSQGKSYTLALPLTTKNQSHFFSGFHRTYSLIPWTYAKKVRRKKRKDWLRATDVLATFHRDSTNYEKPKILSQFFRQNTWKEKALNEANQLQNFIQASAWTEPSEIDSLWNKQSGYIRHLIHTSLQLYEDLNGPELEKSLQTKGRLCHGSFRREHCLLEKDHVTLLDVHHAEWRTSAEELANWMEYAYGQTGSMALVSDILDRYQQVINIEEELPMLYCCTLYPNEYLLGYIRIFQDESMDQEQAIALQRLWQQEQARTGYLHAISQLPAFQKMEVAKITWL